MKKILIALGVVLFLPACAFASIGVGIGTGKIYIKEDLKAGTIYDLPVLSVLNTGDEPSGYEVAVEFNEVQPQNKPERTWFSFEPNQFNLEPGKAMEVKTTLSLPIKNLKPGDYFAYIEARPTAKSENGQTKVGIAAASKLYFTVAPSNIFIGIFYRVTSIFQKFSPWSYVILSLFALTLVVLVFRKYFSFSIGISVKKNE